LTRHASEILGDRFQLYDEAEIRHYLKNAKIIEPFGKEGGIGKLRCRFGDCEIEFVCKISQKTLFAITAKEC
jgi:hypothetical protein